eukprot:5765268-Amphidinium_carterae.1
MVVKALFRRARARLGFSQIPGAMSQVDEAIEDLVQASELEPTNQEIRQALAKARQLRQQSDAKSRHVYAEMLGGGAAGK